MINPELLTVTILLTGGMFGGLVNFYLGKPTDDPAPSLKRSVVVGTAASFLVPVFLNMISSDLIEKIAPNNYSKLLVLLGFCLIASISSTAFIRTLSDRILVEVKNAKREAENANVQAKLAREAATEAQQAVTPIVRNATEPESADELEESIAPEVDPEKRILKALTGKRWTFRSESGLAKEAGVEPSDVSQVLNDLAQAGSIAQRETRNGPRWFITEQGRSLIEQG